MPKDSLQADNRFQDNPLGPHLRTFTTALIEEGYAEGTVHSKVGLLAELGKWLGRTERAVAHLDEGVVEAFVKHRRRVRRGEGRTLQQFLAHLRQRHVVAERQRVRERSPLADLLRRYEQHLRSERGLVTATILNYQPFVRQLLVERFRGGPLRLRDLHPSDIAQFVLRHGHHMSVGRAQLMTTAFRSFFRFLLQQGDLPTDLAAAVPTVADWRLSTVPKYLTPAEVDRVLTACNRRTPTGRRDYAILLLLARLGLRAGEVVALQLEDLDWRAGELLVRGKGLRHDRMPLPPDVGAALTAYLRRDRPPCQTRRVFVCRRAPRRGLAGPSTLTTIVRRALERADLHPAVKGAHLFRHSLATSLLRAGATLGEIGDVLRHRVSSSTELYAKVDFEGLRALAPPWPLGGGR
jgi:site-specific recombinase XerD